MQAADAVHWCDAVYCPWCGAEYPDGHDDFSTTNPSHVGYFECRSCTRDFRARMRTQYQSSKIESFQNN